MLLAATARAQGHDPELLRVNGEWERYWRVLQVAGDVAVHPWSIRPLSPRASVMSAVAPHPWQSVARYRPVAFRGVQGVVLPMDADLITNSAFPFGFNEGPVWAGRGVTAVVRGGVAFRAGALSAAIAPVAFRAQNADFEIMPTGMPGPFAFGFPYPWNADLPQRFGDGAYGRIDPGDSYLRVDAFGLSGGFSTGPQHWGPARDHPIVLGSNAGGFPHLFLGSSAPVTLGPIRVHARLHWGRLSQSAHTPMELVERRRLTVGAVGVISPTALPGLELGAGRFVHVLWSDSVISTRSLLKPFGPLLGQGAANGENQLASVFGRWLIPGAGVEIYGEFAKDDGNLTWRHFVTEPDHQAAYMFGMQRVFGGARGRSTPDSAGGPGNAGRRTAVRAEVLNTRSTTPHLIPAQSPWYVHSPIAQGHTHRGMALGSAGGFGGGAGSLAVDRYSAAGRTTFSWSRLMRAEYLTIERNWVPVPELADVYHAFGVDGVRHRGGYSLTYELKGVYELNRNFARDAFNLRTALGARYTW